MRKKWKIKTPNPKLQVELSDALKIHPIIAQILINRRIETVEEADYFLNGDLSQLHNPFLLKDMDKAVERIKQARDQNERVLIFGDYDVDGVTSSVLLKIVLARFGITSMNYIPHRMQEGYGLGQSIVAYAKERDVHLVITVDCGISSLDVVSALQSSGIDVIILDHHEPGESPLPQAVAVIDPKRQDCFYPYKGLAAVGLVAKLSQALLGRIPEDYLDLVAIGTIADVAELRGENRIFVKAGLPQIDKTKNCGLRALLDVAKISGKKFRPSYVGFILGPRINATGRMGSALQSLDLLLSENTERAYDLARSLEEHNTLRQKIQNNIIEEAMSIIEREVNFKEHKVIVLHKEGWHKGVLGIVASKITEKYYRPTVVISTESGVGTGSARSIEGFHIYDALRSCSSHLENYGGHKRAAGLTVRSENIDFFRKAINDFAESMMQMTDLVPTLELDAQIPLCSISMDLVNRIDSLEPYGEGNPVPMFCSRKLMVKGPVQIMGRETIKFWVTDGIATLPVVGFGMAHLRDSIGSGQKVDLVYSVSIDDWNQQSTISLKLKDLNECE